MNRVRALSCGFLLAIVGGTAQGQAAQRPAPGQSPRREAPISRKDIPAIAKAADGTVATIVMSDKNGTLIAQGSGFLVSRDGLILTNYHVIEEGSSAVVKLPDGAFYSVDGVLAFDKTRDVAVIKAHGRNFRVLPLGNSDGVQVGQEVVAIGNPLSLESTVSNGIVSGIRTNDQLGGKFLQITTPISPGSSGGPLFDMAGDVVGITTMYLKGGENLNFAIPINDAKPLLVRNSAKLQPLPDEATLPEESAETAIKDQGSDEGSSSALPAPAAAANPSDRDYYRQLYEAKAFAEPPPADQADGSSVRSDGRAPMIRNADYACFSDDIYSGTFVTFSAYAYDDQYAAALTAMLTPNARPKDITREIDIQEAVREKNPYLEFLPQEVLAAFPPEAQKFFRDGGRALEETIYEKGVKTGTVEYHWDGGSWLLTNPPADPNAYTRTSTVWRLSIEPATMRYVESADVTLTVGTGETAATGTTTHGPWAGVCEKIPDPEPATK